MLIPQFSLRWLLAATTLVAVVFSIVALAMRGHQWAVAVSAGIVALAVLLLVHAAAFGLMWCLSLVFGRGRGRSPFQVAPPRPQAESLSVQPTGLP